MENTDFIYIVGEKKENIIEVLKDWTEEYFEDENIKLIFKFYKIELTKYAIQVDYRFTNKLFFILVNYLYNSRKLRIVELFGYTSGKENNELKGQGLLIYNSLDDLTFSVSAVTSKNINYRIDFDGKINKTNKHALDYSIFNYQNLENPEIINTSDFFIEEYHKTTNQIYTRFIIFLFISVFIFLFCITTRYFEQNLFYSSTSILGLGIGFWFLLDYKMLRINKFYLFAMAIGITYLFIVLYFSRIDINSSIEAGTVFPLTVLLLQRILRKIYLFLFNLEPKFDRLGTISDAIYSVTLMISAIILSFVFVNLLK